MRSNLTSAFRNSVHVCPCSKNTLRQAVTHALIAKFHHKRGVFLPAHVPALAQCLPLHSGTLCMPMQVVPNPHLTACLDTTGRCSDQLTSAFRNSVHVCPCSETSHPQPQVHTFQASVATSGVNRLTSALRNSVRVCPCSKNKSSSSCCINSTAFAASLKPRSVTTC